MLPSGLEPVSITTSLREQKSWAAASKCQASGVCSFSCFFVQLPCSFIIIKYTRTFQNINNPFKSREKRTFLQFGDVKRHHCKFYFNHNLTLLLKMTSVVSKDTDWSIHAVTGWERIRWNVFKVDLQDFKLKISSIQQLCKVWCTIQFSILLILMIRNDN